MKWHVSLQKSRFVRRQLCTFAHILSAFTPPNRGAALEASWSTEPEGSEPAPPGARAKPAAEAHFLPAAISHAAHRGQSLVMHYMFAENPYGWGKSSS